MSRPSRCLRDIRRWGWGLLLGAAVGSASAQLPRPVAPLTVRSVSGQFLVHGDHPEVQGPGVIPELRDEEWIDLDPNVLAVVAERVRESVDRRLGGLGAWRGKIDLTLRPAARLGPGPLRIIPQLFREGCVVTLEVPDRIEVQRLVRALVEAIVIEAANRGDAGRIVQAPLWLNEGLAGVVMVDSGSRFLVEHGTVLRREGRRRDAATEARRLLAGAEPLTFSELGTVRVADLSPGPGWDRFRGSAILLTRELLREAWGRQGLQTFLARLGRHLNWQTTFLEVFGARFVSLLEVEKWWAMSAAYQLAGDPSQQWGTPAVLDALAGIATEPVEVRTSAEAPVDHRRVPLSEVAAQWEPALRRPVVERKQGEISLLRAHAPDELVPFVEAWTRVLEDLVALDRRAAASGLRGVPGKRMQPVVERLGQLEAELESRRSAR